MKYYDVVIIGGGIAGSSLSYNLKRFNYKGKVLLLEKNTRNPARGYNTRACFQKVVEDYNLPYEYIFKGMKLGTLARIITTINHPVFSVNYRDTCLFLQGRSKADVRKEYALDLKENILITNKDSYRFRYLIDCSGISFFLRKKLGLCKPFRYWIGSAKQISNNHGLEKGYIHNFWNKESDFEEIYVRGDKTLHADWKFYHKIDFSVLKNVPDTYLSSVKNAEVIAHEFRAFPVSTTLPLVFKNYAFLGDSFGNAPASSGFGCEAAIRASEILSRAIIKKDLSYYEREWLRKNFSYDLKFLVSRIDRYEYNPLLKKLKSYPDMSRVVEYMKNRHDAWIGLLQNDRSLKIDNEFKRLFPRKRNLFLLFHLLQVRLRYLLMRYNIGTK